MASFTSLTDFTKIATDERNIRELGELIVVEYLENDLNQIFNVKTGIKGRQQIATVTPGEKYTTKYTKNPTFREDDIVKAVTQVWNPQVAQYRRRIHFDDFKEQWTKWLIGDQGDATAFDSSQVLNFITEYIARGLYSDIVRIALHGRSNLTSPTGTPAKNANKTNILTRPADVQYYDLIDFGLIETFKFWQIESAKTADSQYKALAGNFISIDKNANNQVTGRGTNGQYNLAENYSRNLFDSLVYDSTIDIEPNVIIANNALVQNYERSLTKNNALQSNEDRFISGATGQNALGYNLVALRRYDQQRQNDCTFGSTSHTDTAHFALWANKDNLELAVNAESALRNLTVTFPNAQDDYVYIKGNYEIDFKFTAPVAGGFRCAL